ncbi:MAG TPA: methyltransferase domain-containing protein [Dehalococcoidia bacterium]|nr:methyltransferase domain-containing protein [Dehalococcoidia bacterium]
MSQPISSEQFFARMDESEDALFYAVPRKVVHIDDSAIAAVGRLYQRLLPQSGIFLDLMSSWRSHLPPELRPARVIGLGLNAEEMAENPQLDEHLVHDLNRDPRLPFPEDTFDGVVCAVSIQYLTQPIAVFREVRRVLKPGKPFIVTFSNRCFPSKAIAAWLYSSDEQHLELVRIYFQESGGWQAITAEDCLPEREKGFADPLYGVWAFKAPEDEPEGRF